MLKLVGKVTGCTLVQSCADITEQCLTLLDSKIEAFPGRVDKLLGGLVYLAHVERLIQVAMEALVVNRDVHCYTRQ